MGTELEKSCRLGRGTGIIATNTTIRRDGLKTQILSGTGKPIAAEAGGISGIPVRVRSTEGEHLSYAMSRNTQRASMREYDKR